MESDEEPGPSKGQSWRVLARLDKLVASGRLTAEEAERLRAAGGSSEAEGVLWSIRARHAAGRLRAAVESGEVDEAQADQIVNRVRAGDHTAELRTWVRRLGRSDR